MPLYDYECPKCGNKSERLVALTKIEKEKCNICGSKLNRLQIQKGNSIRKVAWMTKDGKEYLTQ